MKEILNALFNPYEWYSNFNQIKTGVTGKLYSAVIQRPIVPMSSDVYPVGTIPTVSEVTVVENDVNRASTNSSMLTTAVSNFSYSVNDYLENLKHNWETLDPETQNLILTGAAAGFTLTALLGSYWLFNNKLNSSLSSTPVKSDNKVLPFPSVEHLVSLIEKNDVNVSEPAAILDIDCTDLNLLAHYRAVVEEYYKQKPDAKTPDSRVNYGSNKKCEAFEYFKFDKDGNFLKTEAHKQRKALEKLEKAGLIEIKNKKVVWK